jgi:hypothetical protein
MKFWHLQMNQPWGRKSIYINSRDMLEEEVPIIGTGDWDDNQFYNFINADGNGLNNEDIVLVREGKNPIALCKVISDTFSDDELQKKYKNQNFRKVKVLAFYDDTAKQILNKKLEEFDKSFIQASGTFTKCVNKNATNNFIEDWYNQVIKMGKIKERINILDYKKQIILQGPPGTGKTREAKLIANNIFLNELNENSYFGNNLIKNETIFSVAKNTRYRVKSISENYIELEGEDIQDKKITKNKIIDFVKDQNWNAVSNGNDRGAQAIAYHLYQKFIENQFKIIQFHPSYTYEDFVRGIVAKSDEEENGLIYDAENKLLAKFAKEALINFYRSSDKTNNGSIDIWIDKSFEDFKNDLDGNLNDEGYVLSEKVNIFKVRNKDFLYGKDWKTPGHLKFEEFKNLIKAVINQEIDLESPKLDKYRFVHSHYRFTYYGSLLKKFFEKYSYNQERENVDLKNYVLVIDEINRANLSSVLGELIYALEYRGEEVESMYKVDGSQKLILPPNLYIIGTMNTADRSVGHIDYAIRRRFAFVEVLPEKLNDEKIIFHEDWFKKVSELFITNYDEYFADEERKVILKPSKTLSSEFRPEDVWIGHSYFIQKKLEDNKLEPEEFRMKIDYEIKPILMEYVKDGVLVGNVGEQKIEDYIKNL